MLTIINIQAHPGLPLRPSMFWIAAAKRPEKAPDNDAVEKNRAILTKRQNKYVSFALEYKLP